MELPEFIMDLLGNVAHYVSFGIYSLSPLLPTYFLMILAALFPIYSGAHASLTRPSSAAKPKRRKKGILDEDEDVDSIERTQRIEGLKPLDAIVFPLLAGATLTGLYFLIKWLKDTAMLNRILNWYLAVLGVFFLALFLEDGLYFMRSMLFPTIFSKGDVIAKVDPRTQAISTLKSAPLPKNLDADDNKDDINKSTAQDATTPGSDDPPITLKLQSLRSFLYAKTTLKFYLHLVLAAKTQLDIISLVAPQISIAVFLYFNLISKPWWMTNLLGLSFSYSAIQRTNPTTFWTGTLLLSGLFLYDIYMVFFTPMMVEVATKLDIPIKLLVPRPRMEGDDEHKPAFSMLGLGDIVIPGMMSALAIRFDLFMFYLKKQKGACAGSIEDGDQKKFEKATYTPASGGWGECFWTSFDGNNPPDPLAGKLFPKPYFRASVAGYFLGMIVTVGIMHFAQHAQPALLYLVPGVLGSLWGTALWRGEIKEMWNYSEAEDEGDMDKTKEIAKSKVDDNDPGMHKDSWKSWFGIFSRSKVNNEKKDVKQVTTPSEDAEKEQQNPENQRPVRKRTLRPKSKHPLNAKPKSQKTANEKAVSKASKLLSMDLTNHLIYFSVTLPSASPQPSAKLSKSNGHSSSASSHSSSPDPSVLSASSATASHGSRRMDNKIPSDESMMGQSLEDALREATESEMSSLPSQLGSEDDEDDEIEDFSNDTDDQQPGVEDDQHVNQNGNRKGARRSDISRSSGSKIEDGDDQDVRSGQGKGNATLKSYFRAKEERMKLRGETVTGLGTNGASIAADGDGDSR